MGFVLLNGSLHLQEAELDILSYLSGRLRADGGFVGLNTGLARAQSSLMKPCVHFSRRQLRALSFHSFKTAFLGDSAFIDAA